MENKKILVVDDEQSIRTFIQFTLKAHGYETFIAENGEQAVEKVREINPDLVLLDVNMPVKDGVAACAEIRAIPEYANLPVMFLSARSEIFDKAAGFEAGADDYLPKPFETLELVYRVKALLRRQRATDERKPVQNDLRYGKIHIDLNAQQVFVDGTLLELTPIELSLLKFFMSNPGRTFSRDELLEKVWGIEHYGQTRTVDWHTNNLRQKLAAASKELENQISTVRGAGYRFNTDVK